MICGYRRRNQCGTERRYAMSKDILSNQTNAGCCVIGIMSEIYAVATWWCNEIVEFYDLKDWLQFQR